MPTAGNVRILFLVQVHMENSKTKQMQNIPAEWYLVLHLWNRQQRKWIVDKDSAKYMDGYVLLEHHQKMYGSV